MTAIIPLLEELLGPENIRIQEPMSRHTSFQIGGPAELFLTPASLTQLQKAWGLLRQAGIPIHVMGKGSNLLVLDGGIAGAVIQIGPQLGQCYVQENRIFAEAGAPLGALASLAAAHGLSGLEFASGIPGALGGAVAMNAGAYGGEMAQVLQSVTVFTPQGQAVTLPKEDLGLGYRTSRVAQEGWVVLRAVLSLEPGDPEEIRQKIRIGNQQRRSKQPLEFPSAGSAFKRPAGHFAGKLIEDAGLKGCRIGGAAVSQKHAGFIINTGNATAADVLALIKHCQTAVAEKFGVNLEPEIKIWGRP